MGSFAHVPSPLGWQIYGVCGTIQLPLWTMAEFSPSPITRTKQLDSASVVTQLVIQAQPRAPCLPQTLSPHSPYLQTEGPKVGIRSSLSPLAPCKEQASKPLLKSHLEMSSVSQLVV